MSKSKSDSHRPLRAKLIFDANSGRPEKSSHRPADILSDRQVQQILPEVYTVRPDGKLEVVMHNAIKTGIKLIVIAGGAGRFLKTQTQNSVRLKDAQIVGQG